MHTTKNKSQSSYSLASIRFYKTWFPLLLWFISLAAAAKSLQLCPTLCNPKDCSPPGSSVHGISQARTLECIAMSSSRGISSTQGSNPPLLHSRQILYCWATREAHFTCYCPTDSATDTLISMLALECSRNASTSRSSYLLILLHDLSPNILLGHYLKITLVRPSLCFPLPTSIQNCIHVHTCSWHCLFPLSCFIFLHSTYHHPVTMY